MNLWLLCVRNMNCLAEKSKELLKVSLDLCWWISIDFNQDLRSRCLFLFLYRNTKIVYELSKY